MTDIADSETKAWAVEAEAAGVFLFAETTHTDGGATVSVRGELDIASAPALRTRLFELLCLPIDCLILDLSGLDFIDSSGLNVLNQVRTETEERHMPFSLQSVPACVQRVLEVTNMDGLFSMR